MYFKDVRKALILSHNIGSIDDEELCLLYDLYKSKNPDINHWTDVKFDLDTYSEEECHHISRFGKKNIYEIADTLETPEYIRCYNNVTIHKVEALCMTLRRFAYPNRYSDLLNLFGRSVPQISIATSNMVDFLFDRWSYLLTDLNQPWISPDNFETFADLVHAKGAGLQNCWGFVDGFVRPCCRPGQYQRVVYNGHKRVHEIKFQAVATPNGMVANLFGPIEGRTHDSGILAE